MADTSTASDTPPAADDPGPFGVLIEQLTRHRLALLVAYITVFAGFSALLVTLGLDAGITLCHAAFGFLRGDPDPWSIIDSDLGSDWEFSALFIGGFCLLQAGFLWGGGRISIGRTRPKWYRYILSTVIIATLVALLALAAALLIGQYAVTKALLDYDDNIGIIALVVVPGAWLIWFVIAIVLFRRHGHFGGLARLSAALVAGSWVEFALALPIDIATRASHERCLCASGTWLGLLVIIPVMIWSFGPALYLLYLAEKARVADDPMHARRILRAKSVFRRRTQDGAA